MNAWLKTLAHARLTALAATYFISFPTAVAEEPKPGLEIVRPAEGRVFAKTDTISVQAVGIGRFGGILDVELLVDGRVAGESHIRFIRAPEPDEPVFHEFEVKDLGLGTHELVARDTLDLGLVSKPVSITVVETLPNPPGDLVPSLRIVSPVTGAIVLPTETLRVEAVGVGRFGGITRLDLLLDDAIVATSEIVFIRAPEADEPVHHQFELERTPPAGVHRLAVRETGNPSLSSGEVTFHVVEPIQSAAPPLLRLTTLADGVLLLVVTGEDPAATFDIQASYDLLNWQSVNPVKPAIRGPVATGLAEPSQTRFYRAVAATMVR